MRERKGKVLSKGVMVMTSSSSKKVENCSDILDSSFVALRPLWVLTLLPCCKGCEKSEGQVAEDDGGQIHCFVGIKASMMLLSDDMSRKAMKLEFSFIIFILMLAQICSPKYKFKWGKLNSAGGRCVVLFRSDDYERRWLGEYSLVQVQSQQVLYCCRLVIKRIQQDG